MGSTKEAVFIGIDIGTQGIRVIAITETGTLLTSDNHHFSFITYQNLQIEQSPTLWWSCLVNSLKKVSDNLKKFISLEQIVSLSVTSTSGTVIPLDQNYQPISNAFMYSDKRSYKEAEFCKQSSMSINKDDYTPFNTSFGLPKIVWFTNKFPEKADSIHLWCNPTDYIIGKLTDIWGITDYTNSLKMGYNLVKEKWPSYIFDILKLPNSWFPQVVHPGKVLGYLSPKISAITGLPNKIKVVAGLTDGCASQIASGAVSLGDWNTTIGTTMVVKGVTYRPIEDPYGRIYNHKHPSGYWMPGGASNTGADWISKDFSNENLHYLNEVAKKLIPTSWISYPLQQKGERFPFIYNNAQGFDPHNVSKEELYTARIEGIAYLERLSYEIIEKFSVDVKTIYTAGGGSNSDVWLAVRSNVLQKPIYKMKYVEAAIGAAIVAASQTYYKNIEQAAKQMLKLEKYIEPSYYMMEKYEENYQRFVNILKTKGYIS